MLDLIFGVKSSVEWHEKNLKQNSHHYSWLVKFAKAEFISKLQRNYGASIYYNVDIEPIQGERVKYGVISVEDLKEDLINWKTLYVSGRLHKPVNSSSFFFQKKIAYTKISSSR